MSRRRAPRLRAQHPHTSRRVPPAGGRGFTLAELLVVITIIGLMLAILLPNFARARGASAYTACKGNLKNIGTAFEMYANDNHGLYPNLASLVVPKYIGIFPTCPSAGVANYNALTVTNPDIFTVTCLGRQHALVDVGTNLPQYQSGRGVIGP